MINDHLFCPFIRIVLKIWGTYVSLVVIVYLENTNTPIIVIGVIQVSKIIYALLLTPAVHG